MKRSKAIIKEAIKENVKWKLDKLSCKLDDHTACNSINMFKQDNFKGDVVYPTTKFFQDNKTELFELSAAGNKYEMFESMRIYVERFGRPYNYLKSMTQLNDEREKALLEEEAAAKAEKEAQEHSSEAEVEAKR